ncbi:DUF1206 domain-containing protein [Arthrobacter sp. H20]|uniref:DUF1206 domain-containing protein n=1 Tax=Arthrobacter sp. H20 TaxID=1267981 RepID=UPI000479E7E6|nr:DUF1206 domain-containing protein [Arthrobacter sp. H20]
MSEAKRQAGKAADAAEDVSDSKAFEIAARAGYIAAGLLHLLIGVIALRVAMGGSGSADQSGAISALGNGPGGSLLLWACSIGSIALALFMLSEVFFGAHGMKDSDKLKFRAKNAAKGVTYGVIGGTFATYAAGGSSDSSESTQNVSASLMSNPAGSFLLIAVGAAVMVVGGYFIYSGVTRKFRENLSGLPGKGAGTAVVRLGMIGYVAKGAALLVLGLLFIVATLQNDPEESTGLDGALKSLQGQPYGAWILGVIAVGLIAYGVFMVIRSRYQKM